MSTLSAQKDGTIPGNRPDIPTLLRADSKPFLSRQESIDAFRIPPINLNPRPNNALALSPRPIPMRVDLKKLDLARQQLQAISSLAPTAEQPVATNDTAVATTFAVEAPEKKGLLWLQTGAAWEQKWCVLKEGYLYVFESQQVSVPTHEVWLSAGVVKDRPDIEDNCFSVTTSDKKTWILHADEEYDYFTWIVSLRGATFYLRIAGTKSPLLAAKAPNAAQMPRLSVHPAALKAIPPVAQAQATQSQANRPASSEGPYLYFGTKAKVTPTVDKRATKFFGTHRRHSSPEIQPIFSGKIKSGYLTVPEGKVFTTWKPRWVLLEGDALYVFNSEADEPNKDEAMFTIEVLFCNAKVVKSTQKNRYIFDVITTAKTVTFGAATGAELLEWIGAIQEAQATLMGQYLQYDVLSTSAPTPTNGYSGEDPSDELAKSKQMLNKVLQIPGNDKCADCTSTDILWASINLGVFLCINCSGVHRSLGVHISKVRSVTMDKWENSTVQFMEEMGNSKVNAILEYHFPTGYGKLLPTSTTGEREQFIRNKYEAKLFSRPA